MNARLFSLGLIAASGLALGLATGCNVLPEAKPDPTRFYVLKASRPPAAAVENSGAVALRLRPIELADYLRTRALIVRRDDNELDFRDYARWSEALGPAIARVVREEMRARGVAVSAGGLKSGGAPTESGFELRIRVLACEGAADGGVRFHAAWELVAIGGVAARRGDYRPTTLRWDAQNEATLVAALSEAVAGLAGEIAATVKR